MNKKLTVQVNKKKFDYDLTGFDMRLYESKLTSYLTISSLGEDKFAMKKKLNDLFSKINGDDIKFDVSFEMGGSKVSLGTCEYTYNSSDDQEIISFIAQDRSAITYS